MAERHYIANALFRRRALAEAARYGSDPWVFVRELLQNSRDAGARRITLTTSGGDGRQRVSCRDDGAGMSLEHARRYLFALYASSKDDRDAEAGKFGIGFWSVLRFEPSAITVRSRSGGEAWEVALDGQLEWASVGEAERVGTDVDAGTEVVLERAADGGDLSEEVFAAARRYGRFLTLRGKPDEILPITVDGRPVNAELALPAPSANFSGKGFRGVVGLGRQPRVEIFAHGLFVRSASSLRELAEDGEDGPRDGAEGALADLPSLAPRVILDGTELDLLLARSDARQDRHLRRMLRAAEKALERLITRQLQALRPQPWLRLWWGALRDRLEPLLARPAAAIAVVAALALALFLGNVTLPSVRSLEPPAGGSPRGPVSPMPARGAAPQPSAGALAAFSDGAGTETATGGASAGGLAAPQVPLLPSPGTARLRRYSDLSRRYRGPDPSLIGGSPSAIVLSYQPAVRPVLFNALVIETLEGFHWTAPPIPDELPRYRGTTCTAGCIDVELLIDRTPGPLRIPMPAGHRLEASSLRLGGLPEAVWETASGEAVVRVGETAGSLLEYRTGPAPDPAAPQHRPADPTRDPVPAGLALAAGEIRDLPPAEIVRRALPYVAGHITYDRSAEVARAYERDPGAGFAATALAVGAGDCDVQNGVLVELLRLAGVEARLALGYVGFDGRVAAGLHAWAEYRGGDGRWHAADASAFAPPAAALAGRPRPRRSAAGAADRGMPADVVAGIVSAPAGTLAPALAGLVLLLAASGAGLAVRRRRAAALALDPAGNLAELLGGALRHPEAFAALPAMSHGRFIPLVGRAGALSLDSARRLASRRRLFRSRLGSRLARDAAARGVPVVDSATAEGRVASLALGAIDLDHWSELLERSSDGGLGYRINLLLRDLGEPWRVRLLPGLGEPLLELALEDLGLGRRVVLLDPGHPVFAAAVRAGAGRPATAGPETVTFGVLDLVLQRVELDDRNRDRLLAAAARQALLEAFPR